MTPEEVAPSYDGAEEPTPDLDVAGPEPEDED
jgi:hypothetical protein